MMIFSPQISRTPMFLILSSLLSTQEISFCIKPVPDIYIPHFFLQRWGNKYD